MSRLTTSTFFSRMQIEKLLMEQEAAMLFVEHDAAFCENYCR